MPGRPKARGRFRLASGPQRWRLNTLGRLALTDDAVPISSTEASVIIAAAAASLEFVPARCAPDGSWGAPQRYENERDYL
ncbi:MAG: hypothetical protein ACRDO9_00725, partial [Gaiellales bacterium]